MTASGWARTLLCLPAALALLLASYSAIPAKGQPSRTWLKEERFDRDPHWDAAHNRIPATAPVKQNDFGYQPGEAGKRWGRIGGMVWRSLTPAYYAMRLPTLSLEKPLSASGTLALTQAKTTVGYQNGSTIFLGFFHHREQGWRPVNFVGFRMEGFNEPDGATVEVSYGTRLWTAGGATMNAQGGAQERNVKDLDSRQLLRIAPDGRRHTWSLRYDPTDAGRIILTVDGAEMVHPLRPEHRGQGAEFTRFGLFNGQLPGNELTAYIDDLTVNGRKIDLSKDPGWEGNRNHATLTDRVQYGANDFGYSRSRHAGGRTGELGGRSWRVQEPEFKGYYGDDVGTLTLDDPLFASGSITFPRFSVDSGLHLGWFNAAEQGWPPRNFVGAYLDSYTPTGRFITPMYGTSEARRAESQDNSGAAFFGAAAGGWDLLFYPDSRVYYWSLQYDPLALQGRGTVTVSLNANSPTPVLRFAPHTSWRFETRSITLPLQPGDRKRGAVMNRFGVFNMQDNNGKECLSYLDNLSYTTARAHEGR